MRFGRHLLAALTIATALLLLAGVAAGAPKGGGGGRRLTARERNILRLGSTWMSRGTQRQLLRLKPGAFAFDFDGTLAGVHLGGKHADVGQAFIEFMVRNKYFPKENRARMERLWERFKAEGDPHKVLQKHSVGLMSRLYPEVAMNMSGLTTKQAEKIAREFVQKEVKPYIYRPMRKFVRALKAAGFEPWIVTAGVPFWVVREVARELGLPPDHVIGPKTEVRTGKLTERYLFPDPIGSGKVTQIAQNVSVKLVGAAGDSGGDLAMLQAAPFRIAINPNKSLAKHARENGWPIERLDSVGLTEGDCIARAMSKSHGPPDKPRKR
ncbi:MAG: HAD-IB family phosphatase [Myxococcales bacterium]|nr:HAD-IB family phosphatase [Myxococcales bacterium]